MHHEFHFKRGDLELAFKGERDFVEAQLRAFAALMQAAAAAPAVELDVRPEPPPAAEELPRVSPDFRPRRNISLADLVKMKAAVAPTDLVVVAGYYMEKYMQTEAFDASQLTEQLRGLPWREGMVDEAALANWAGHMLACLTGSTSLDGAIDPREHLRQSGPHALDLALGRALGLMRPGLSGADRALLDTHLGPGGAFGMDPWWLAPGGG